MRLTPHYVSAIREAAAEAFGDTAAVRLFGSRVHDHLRGGDIDLLIEVEPDRATIHHESRFLSALFRQVDEQKVDLVLVRRGEPVSPFAAMVAAGSVPL